MSVFQDITFEFEGEQYSIKANAVFPLIAQIDEVMPLSELLAEKTPSIVKMCHAFSVCIMYAGGNVSAEVVFDGLFGENPVNPREVVQQLQMFVIPPAKYQAAMTADDSKKK
jgi:hypothetical protein